MKNFIWSINLFTRDQRITIQNGNVIDYMYYPSDSVKDVLINLAGKEDECTIYLTGVDEKFLKPVIREIKQELTTKYSNKNIEVKVL